MLSKHKREIFVKYKLLLLFLLLPLTLLALFFSQLATLSANKSKKMPPNSGVTISKVNAECSKVAKSEICESNILLSLKNLTSKPQRYLVIKAEIYNEKGKTINNECLSGYEIIDIGRSLQPQQEKKVRVLYRKYYKYSSAKIISATWYGKNKPEPEKVYPELAPGALECP